MQQLHSSEDTKELRQPVRIFYEHAEPQFQCLGSVGCNTAVHRIASVMYSVGYEW